MLQDLFWIQNFSDNWDNTDNWSLSSGGPSAGIVPDTTHRAIFDSNGSGSCFIDTTADVGGLLMSSDYSSSLIQVADPIYIAEDASFVGGSFVGDSADMTVQGSVYINANFKATDKTFSILGDFVHRKAGGSLESKIYSEEITLDSADITNKFVALSNEPDNSANVAINLIRGVSQYPGIDYYMDGAHVRWDSMRLENDLIAGDTIRALYKSQTAPVFFDHNHGKVDLAVSDNTFSGGGIQLWNLEISGDTTTNHMFVDTSAYVENKTFLTNVFFKGTDASLFLQGDVTSTSTVGRWGEGLGVEILFDGFSDQTFLYTGSIIPNLGVNKDIDHTAICEGSGPLVVNGDFNIYFGVFNTNGLSVEVGNV